MFFFLSKALLFLIRPMFWVLVLAFLAFISKRAARRRRYALIMLLFLIFFSNKGLYEVVCGRWELPPQKLTQSYDIGILLGGYSNSNGYPQDGRHHFNASVNRLTQTLELYQQGKIRNILLTGGSSNIITKGKLESQEVVDFVEDMGIDRKVVIVEPQARNTWENALYSAKIIKAKYPQATCVLITSAWHMRRARACFRKAGLEFDYYCTDYKSTDLGGWAWLQFEPGVLGDWEGLFKEWVGMLVYAVKGYV